MSLADAERFANVCCGHCGIIDKITTLTCATIIHVGSTLSGKIFRRTKLSTPSQNFGGLCPTKIFHLFIISFPDTLHNTR